MNNVDIRPKLLGTVTGFRENDLPVTVEIDEEIDFTAEEVRVEIWTAFELLYIVETFSIDDHNVYIQLTKDQVKALPTLAKCQVVIRDYYTFGYNIIAELGFGTPIGNNFRVGINLKGAAGDITPQLTALATQVSNDKADVLAAKAEVIGVAARKVDGWEVDTLAEAQAFAPILEKSSLIFVVADESQGNIRATYVWDTNSLQEILLL